jgi:hypothetical protein
VADPSIACTAVLARERQRSPSNGKGSPMNGRRSPAGGNVHPMAPRSSLTQPLARRYKERLRGLNPGPVSGEGVPEMRKVFTVVAGAAFVAALSVAAPAAEPVTVTGEVVEVACANGKGEGGRGEAHANCAMACAKRGNQMGILTEEAIYLIEGDYSANNNAKLLDFIAKTVEARGELSEKDGQKVLNVSSMSLASR